MILALIQGIAVGLGLIVAIGPQNTFVIQQGIKRQHEFVVALVCTLTDVVLIGLGVFGLGAIFNLHPALIEAARWFGAVFLTFYGLLAFKSAIHPKTLRSNGVEKAVKDTSKIILILLGLGFLNPHAYLDAVVLIGSIASQHPGSGRYFFGLGAMLASALWFFTIAYGARVLSPIFKKESSWRVLDIIIGCMMIVIAVTLVF